MCCIRKNNHKFIECNQKFVYNDKRSVGKGIEIMGCFINFSNHPSELWTDEQRDAAYAYGEIVDLKFPAVEANASERDILKLAENYCEKIIAMHPSAVMCQGEFTFSFAVIQKMLKRGICCVAACSERVTTETYENGKTVKQAAFTFVRFREYRELGV